MWQVALVAFPEVGDKKIYTPDNYPANNTKPVFSYLIGYNLTAR